MGFSQRRYGAAFLLLWGVRCTYSFTAPALPSQNQYCLEKRSGKRTRYFASRRRRDESMEEEEEEDATMSTALCVIPPDAAWDTIQRARHIARDRSYHKWPPAIRLFHPFCPRSKLSNVALEIARIVEEYKIEPFEVVLNTWTIVPHMESLEADLEAMRQLPSQESLAENGGEEETDMDRLIANEERIGKQRQIKRDRKNRQKSMESTPNNRKVYTKRNKKGEVDEPYSFKESPRDLLEKQRQMYEEFNGPCVVCLEPDEESRQRLLDVREILRKELFQAYGKYSPSSSVSVTDKLPRSVESDDVNYRPLVPVASFPTVTSAIEMARKLKGLWEPLAFNVTDFHLLSHSESDASSPEQEVEDFSDNREYILRKTSWMKDPNEEEVLTSQGQFGCDALVMLMGEEMNVDPEESQEMVNFIMSQGSPGGYGLSKEVLDQELALRRASEDETNGLGNLEQWLDIDEEWDEGSVVVIGRTHFFTGEMRIYVGMPASSVVDAKDRILGEGVSASARRRGTVHRAYNVWKDGEFGHRESDYVS